MVEGLQSVSLARFCLLMLRSQYHIADLEVAYKDKLEVDELWNCRNANKKYVEKQEKGDVCRATGLLRGILR